MKTLLIYPPFCTPCIPPYSLANIYTFLKNNKVDVDVLDLNLEFHKKRFSEYQKYYQNISLDDYEEKTNAFMELTKKVYSESNWAVVRGETPEMFDEMYKLIIEKKPELVALSIVFSSQAFYASALIDRLNKEGIKVVVGGPATNEGLIKKAIHLKNEVELLEEINGKCDDYEKLIMNEFIDFSVFDLNEYFTKDPVIPVRTSSTCYYGKCAFCTHQQNKSYYEYPLDYIKNTIIKSGAKNFFFIDDMIHKKRLISIANEIKELNIKWSCQLRPGNELDKETLQILFDSGLKSIVWGVESGCDRILNLMKKTTNKKDIAEVLKNSHEVGIINGVYIMFGFPTETKDEYLETIQFLEDNINNIDLVSTSIFGLQKGSVVYEKPDLFGITKIHEEARTILEPKISYEVSAGLTNEQATHLRKRYKKTIEKINKLPKSMNYFREHMFML